MERAASSGKKGVNEVEVVRFTPEEIDEAILNNMVNGYMKLKG